jgi:hypothetical protein
MKIFLPLSGMEINLFFLRQAARHEPEERNASQSLRLMHWFIYTIEDQPA